MRTIIRNSYTPKTGDYCNKIVVDEDTGTQYIFDCDGIYTTYTSKQQEGAPMFYVDSKVASATNEAKSYADTQDQIILQQAKDYTDEHGGGGGGGDVTKAYVDAQDTIVLNSAKAYADEKDNLFYINVTDVDFSEGTFTADKTYAEILEAYNAGKLPIVIVKEEDSSYRYNGIYMLRSYGVNEESDGFDFAYVNADGNEGRISAGSWTIHIGNEESRAAESYGHVEIDPSLNQYSNHAVSNSAVCEALSQKVSQADLATVATSGSYNDLSNKPAIPTFTLTTTDPGEGATLAANAFIGVYNG